MWVLRASAGNREIVCYGMDAEEIRACVEEAVSYGYGTVVLQSGEDSGTTAEWMGEIVRHIKSETPLAVTLSLGERTKDELRYWRSCGADRYLLRFETANPHLFAKVHPPRSGETPSDRIALLKILRDLGYETGSGALIGIPGQTYADLV